VKPRRTPTSNFVFRLEGGTEDNDLWVRRDVEDGIPTINSVWVPSDEERAAIAAGANLELTVWGQGTPPVALRTTDEQPGRVAAEGGSV
jgi:hypothetical protein